MDAIRRITLKLKKYITSQAQTVAKPVKVTEHEGSYYLILKDNKSANSYLSARSLDGFDFDLTDNLVDIKDVNDSPGSGVIELNDKKIKYFSDRQIYLETEGKKKPLILSSNPTEFGGIFLFPNGIILLYFEKIVENGMTHYKAHLAEFDKKHPDRLLWQTEQPIWSSYDHWPDAKIVSLGAVMIKNKIIMYWYVDEKIIYGVSLSSFYVNPLNLKKKINKLHKHAQNPIISPQDSNEWEAFTTLNPAATYLDNKVHILYRAQGYDYISTVGYATSSDGVTIDNRLNSPIYQPSADFETNKTGSVDKRLMSAGGYGGCEDPRITLLDGRMYMVYVAFDGWSNLRLAMTSISINDFLNQRWNWEKPVLISPPHIIDKSGCLLPEKIDGSYVFFHRVFPNILIDFVEDLNFKGKNKWLKGEYQIKVRPGKWDSRKIGAGAPPLKTKDGWLLIYYGVDDKDPYKYHIGAMLLDLKDPTKVLYRSNSPILSPEEEYENNGFKPGITYPCGAVIIKDTLFVYYGAADSVVCVARAHLDTFVGELKSDKKTHLLPVEIKEVHI